MARHAGVRAAAPSDLVAAIGFLPWIAAADLPLENIVVADGDAGLCAVAALSPQPAGAGTMLADLAVHPRWRRRGLATALLDRLADEARAWGATRLRGLRGSDDAATQAFLERAGARPLEPLVTYEAELDRASFATRLGRRAAASGGAVRALADSDLPRIAAYYAAHLGATPAAALARLQALRADPVLASVSLVLERAGRVLGFVLFRHDPDGILRLDYWFAEATARGTTALALLAAAAERARVPGTLRLRFQAGVGAVATHRLARELGAAAVRREIVHELAL